MIKRDRAVLKPLCRATSGAFVAGAGVSKLCNQILSGLDTELF